MDRLPLREEREEEEERDCSVEYPSLDQRVMVSEISTCIQFKLSNAVAVVRSVKRRSLWKCSALLVVVLRVDSWSTE